MIINYLVNDAYSTLQSKNLNAVLLEETLRFILTQSTLELGEISDH